MTDDQKTEEKAPPQGGPSPEANRVARAIALALFMIPIGGLAFMIAGNAVLYGWLEIVPKMTYGEACGGMALAWLVRFFMYR